MRKISKFLAVIAISIMAVCVPAQASEITPEVTAAPTVTAVPVQPTAAPTRKKGLVKEGKKYVYYDKKGNKLKNKWKTIHKNRYYFDANGKAVTGGKRIGKYIYVFKTDSSH